jgi:hypothetical protein
VLFVAVSGAGVAVTEKALPFVEAFQKRYGNAPSHAGFSGRGSHPSPYFASEIKIQNVYQEVGKTGLPPD